MSRAYNSLSQIRTLGELKTLVLDAYESLIRLSVVKASSQETIIKKEIVLPQKDIIKSQSETLENKQIKKLIVGNEENELEKALKDMAQSGNGSQDILKENIKDDGQKIIRKPILGRTGIENRSQFLVKSLAAALNPSSQLLRLEELCSHLHNYPESKGLLIKNEAIRLVLRLREYSRDESVCSQAREALSLLGYIDPPTGSGIRILTIDGGGTRGIMAIEMLRELESRTGKRIHELFDLICGVSTGAILALLFGGLLMPLDQCEVLYRKMSCDIFNQNPWLGTGRLFWNHAYYDTSIWVNLLRTTYGEGSLYEISRRKSNPKIAVMSAIMNQPSLQAYMFRSYSLPYQSQSNYLGSCNHKAWQAIRASAAAPGYFEDFALNGLVHQDGGLLWNNPTALAIHEAKLLWPKEELTCVFSLGTGRFIPPHNAAVNSSTINLKTKILKILDSATDTEGVHQMLHDLLPPDVYFRLNPYLTESVTMDENRPQKLQQLKMDAQMYVRRNEHKVAKAADILIKPRKKMQKILDWIQMQRQLKL